MEKKTTRSIRVEPNFWRNLKVHCAERDIDISEFVQETIEPIITEKEKKINLQFEDKEKIDWEDLRKKVLNDKN